MYTHFLIPVHEHVYMYPPTHTQRGMYCIFYLSIHTHKINDFVFPLKEKFLLILFVQFAFFIQDITKVFLCYLIQLLRWRFECTRLECIGPAICNNICGRFHQLQCHHKKGFSHLINMMDTFKLMLYEKQVVFIPM